MPLQSGWNLAAAARAQGRYFRHVRCDGPAYTHHDADGVPRNLDRHDVVAWWRARLVKNTCVRACEAAYFTRAITGLALGG